MSLCSFESAFYIFFVIEVILRNVEKQNHHKSKGYLLVQLASLHLSLNWNLIKKGKEEFFKTSFRQILIYCEPL